MASSARLNLMVELANRPKRVNTSWLPTIIAVKSYMGCNSSIITDSFPVRSKILENIYSNLVLYKEKIELRTLQQDTLTFDKINGFATTLTINIACVGDSF
jgi:hypothetical protein